MDGQKEKPLKRFFGVLGEVDLRWEKTQVNRNPGWRFLGRGRGRVLKLWEERIDAAMNVRVTL